MKHTDKEHGNTIEEKLNAPFRSDDRLMRMAWSISACAGLDDCAPIYVLM